MIDTSFLDELSRFNLIVNKRVTSNYGGERRSVAHGRGLIIKDRRVYAPGDDFRAIDWNVYARTDKLHIKTFEEDKSLVTHILVDFSGSMNFGKPSKHEFASMLGIGFGYLVLRGNEKFRFATFGDKLDVFPNRSNLNHLAFMVDHLNKLKPKGKSQFRFALEAYKRQITSRSMIVLISDFLFDVEEFKKGLYVLGDHEIKVIQVLDRIEKDLNIEGDNKLKDAEDGSILRTFVSGRLRSKYQSMLDEHVAKLENVCISMGASFHQVITDSSIFDAFYDILG